MRGNKEKTWLFLVCLTALASLFAACSAPKPGNEFMESMRLSPTGSELIPGVHDMKKGTATRGSSALSVVLQHWGIRMTADELEDLLKIDEASIASIEERMMKLADHQGLWTFAQYGNLDLLEERIEKGIPVMVILQNIPGRPEKHYGIVTGFSRANRLILVHEGTGRAETHHYTSFRRYWSPARRWMLSVLPAEAATWPLSMMEHVSRARFYIARDDCDAAEADVEAALAMEPEYVDLLITSANLFRTIGNRDRAEGLYRRAFSNEPLNPRASNNLAYFLAESGGRLEEAESLALRAVMLEPGSPASLDTMGFVLYQQGRYDEAAVYLERARTRAGGLAPEHQQEIAIRLADCYLKDEQPNLTRQVLRDMRRRFPDVKLPDSLVPYAPGG